jgi:hypothetical protein
VILLENLCESTIVSTLRAFLHLTNDQPFALAQRRTVHQVQESQAARPFPVKYSGQEAGDEHPRLSTGKATDSQVYITAFFEVMRKT